MAPRGGGQFGVDPGGFHGGEGLGGFGGRGEVADGGPVADGGVTDGGTGGPGAMCGPGVMPRRSAGGRGVVGGGRCRPDGRRRRLARVDQFEAQSGGEGGVRRRRRAGAASRSFQLGLGLRPYSYLHAVRVADPQRGRRTAHPAGGALGGVRVGRVVGVVCLDVLPAGPGSRAGRAGADLDAAVEFGVRVVPDHADEREVPYVPAGKALFGGGAEGAVAGEGHQRQRLGAAGRLRGRRPSPGRRGRVDRRGRGGLSPRRGRSVCRGPGWGRRKGQGGRTGDTDRGSKESTHAPDPGHSHTYLSIGELTDRRTGFRRTGDGARARRLEARGRPRVPFFG